MFSSISGGSIYEVQGLKCNLPPVGHVYNRLTGKVEKREIIARSHKKAEQYWQRQELPEWWKKREKEEAERMKSDPEYFDPEMNKIIEREWDRRLNGVWFMNNGTPTYLTGLHYFYLNWWQIDVGYPKFRIPDMEYFYFLEYCIQDPECLGMIEITKRRFGKSYRAGVFLYEYTSRARNARAGIQSKTDKDAGSLFQRAVIYPFKKMVPFFRPDYDKSGTLKKDITFTKTPTRGKKSNLDDAEGELNSVIDFRSAEKVSYDGEKLYRYVGDEFGKTENVDIYDRHQVNYYCLVNDEGRIIGKGLYTTTVEELDAGGSQAKLLWEDSDHLNKGGFKRTKSGLYRFFTPAHHTRYFNQYGFADIDKALEEILEERKSLASSPRALSARIRKEPLTPDEAFRVDGDKCLFNSMKLNDRLDRLGWMKNYRTRGNLIWQNGERDTKVVWEPSPNGRFYACWLPKNWEEDCNKVVKRGSRFVPLNTAKFVMGVDPFDHSNSNDSRRSKAAAFVLKKFDSTDTDYEGSFVMMYLSRPDKAQIFYEDMVKACVYFGCQMLFENNKIGIHHYFEERGYSDFLMWLPGQSNPGLPASERSHQELAEETEAYIEDNIDSVFHPELIKDWLDFNLKDTQKFDAAMAAGYTLIADKRLKYKQKANDLVDINRYFKKRKILN